MHDHKHDSFNCRQAFERLFDMLDGELSPDVEQRMRDHVSGCPDCHTQADFEKRFLSALHAVGLAGAAPNPLRERVLQALKAEGLSGG